MSRHRVRSQTANGSICPIELTANRIAATCIDLVRPQPVGEPAADPRAQRRAEQRDGDHHADLHRAHLEMLLDTDDGAVDHGLS